MSTISASTTSTTAYKVTADTTGTLVLQTGSTPTTAVTIDGSQNVGIGTSSPSRKLTIEASGASFPSASNPTVRLNETSSGRFAVVELDSSQNLNIWNGDAGAGAIRFYRGSGSGTLSMTLDGSGNLGLGVTPSALLWPNGSTGGLQLQAGALLSAYNATTYLSNNWYYNAGEKYIGNGYATRYEQTTGKHVWYYAGNNSSGAGAAVSWTQAMTLDASGRLGVGTTSPSYKVHTAGSTVAANSIWMGYNGSAPGSGNAFNAIYFGNGSASGTDRNVRIEAFQDGSFSDIIGLRFFTQATDAGGALERARIDSSGNFYLSGNTTMGPLTDNQGTVGDGSHRWRVIYAVNGTIQTSDGTQKTDVQTSNLGLDFISALNPVSFKWIDSTYGRTHYGFIAQEIEQTLKDKNAGDFGGLVIDELENGSKMYGLRHHELIAPLVKAIQELNAKVDAQAAEIAALKG